MIANVDVDALRLFPVSDRLYSQMESLSQIFGRKTHLAAVHAVFFLRCGVFFRAI